MKSSALLSMAGMLVFSSCQHNERIVEPVPKTAPAAYNKYIHFELGDSLFYGPGVAQTYTHIDSILEINGHLYYRFRSFPYGPGGGVWPDFVLRPDSDGNIRILNSYSTDSGTIYTDSTLFRFDGGIGSSWTFYRGVYEYLGILESLTDTVISGSTVHLRCARIHVWGSREPGEEQFYWLAPGIGVVRDDWWSGLGISFIPPPPFLTWWNFHPRTPR